MTQYRKKPVVIEAFRWTGSIDPSEDPKWIVEAITQGKVNIGPDYLSIATLEGCMHTSLGDYIIKGIQGEIYPCKPDIFNLTYEPVEDRGN